MNLDLAIADSGSPRRPGEWRRAWDIGQTGTSSFLSDIPFEFVEEDRSARDVGELDSYRKKPPESPGILDGVDDWSF